MDGSVVWVPYPCRLSSSHPPISLPEDQMVNCLMHPKSSGSMMQMIPNLFDQVLACNKVVNILVQSNPMQSRKHKAPAKHKQAVMDDTNTDADNTDFTTFFC
ncbi:hypothetical protein F5148DRAFT_1153304 [Russula earlei]|uniref:Uncharacterized protein n=1 Tax=Russula earlei TaxID=71964 RepID=A0ACC0TU21_9AGAM|nr:hypothetical protein F5148DRAFT_1153304 [Russula earlei]